MKQGSFALARLCCPDRHHYYDPLRLPLGYLPLPGITGYRQTRSRPPQGRGRVGPLQFPRQPCDRSTPTTPGDSSTPAPRTQVSSMAFTKSTQARHLLFPASRREPSRRCRLRFMLRTGHSLHPASTTASQPHPEASLPGTLASPQTGLTPAGHQELLAQLRHDNSFSHSARTTGRTWIQA